MKVVALLLLIVCGLTASLAEFEPINYTGSLKASSPTFYPPSWDGNNCAENKNAYVYKWFNVNFNESGVWHVIASAEESIQKDFQVCISNILDIYTSFDPALPCQTLLLSRALTKQLITTTLSGPVVNDFVYLHHPSYVFVISAPLGSYGTFALNSGTTVGSPLWPIVVLSNTGTCQSYTNSLSTPFAYYTWTQPSNGLFDIYAMFDSPLATWFSFLALYNSELTWQQLQTPCAKNGAGKFLQAASGSVQAKGAGLWAQSLKAKANYTIAFSGYGNTQVGYYGIRIVPTQVRTPVQTPFVQPQRGIAECLSDPYNDDSSWDAIQFTAEYPAYLVDTADVVPPLTLFDTYSFLYQGQNTASPPTGCPFFAQLLTQADTGDIQNRKLTTIGTNYTAVISTFSGKQTGTSQDYAYILYVITGDYLPDNQTAHPSASSDSRVAPSTIFSVLFIVLLILEL